MLLNVLFKLLGLARRTIILAMCLLLLDFQVECHVQVNDISRYKNIRTIKTLTVILSFPISH